LNLKKIRNELVDKQRVLIRVLIIASILFLHTTLLLVKFVFAQDVSNFPAAIHIQSNFSDGRFTVEQLVEKAKAKDIKILIITDTFLRKWEYGIWPFRNLIKRRVEENSVVKRGIEKYLETIKEIQRKNPDITLIAGVEVVPFYCWRGNILRGRLALHDWHKQLLVIGLETIDDYRNLPIVGNRSFSPRHWQGFIRLWPTAVIIAGIFLLRLKKRREKLFPDNIEIYKNKFRFFRNLGYVFVCLGILFLFNNFPFKTSRYDQYSADSKAGPYQDLIDYVNQNNGMVFWAHPEASYSGIFQNIRVITRPYKYALWKTKDYTGFPLLYYDNTTITEPGDLWDQILLHYSKGGRDKPVWGFGEIDYDGNTFKELDGIQTVFLLKDFNKREVMQALRNGKMYAKLNMQKNDFYLSKFIVTDVNKKTAANMGDEIVLKGKPQIFIEANCSYPDKKKVTLRLIRNGEIIKTFVLEGSEYSVEFEDDYYQINEKIFYRLEIESNSCRILSNPIFVQFF